MEIERKWLVCPGRIPYDLPALRSYTIEQAYISFYPTIRIRKINNGEKHILTVKTHPEGMKHAGLQREETELPLSAHEYNALMKRVCGTVIRKTRYLHEISEGLTEEIDIFHGALEGLAFVEIEFPDTESALKYPDPVWAERDVTFDNRYKNSSLAENGLPEAGN